MGPTIVLVDDHEVVRQGIRHAVEARDAGQVIGEAASVAEARAILRETSPDVVIVDVVLPDGDGVQLCREIIGDHPDTACVLLTSFPERRGMLSAALAGSAAYLAKDSSAAEVVDVIARVGRGERLLDEDRIVELLEGLAEESDGNRQLQTLTRQELRVFELIGQGLSNRQIADQLHLAERTVKNYVSRMLTKLDMDRRTEAAVLSARMAERRGQQRGRGTARSA